MASAMTFRRVLSDDENHREISDVQPSCLEVFQFNYADNREQTLVRFEEWLEEVSSIGLEQWRRSVEI